MNIEWLNKHTSIFHIPVREAFDGEYCSTCEELWPCRDSLIEYIDWLEGWVPRVKDIRWEEDR